MDMDWRGIIECGRVPAECDLSENVEAIYELLDEGELFSSVIKEF